MRITLTAEDKKKKINNPQKMADIMSKILEADDEIDQDKEHFWVIELNIKNIIKNIELVSLGTLNSGLAEPREVFRRAVTDGAATIILCHNHPSGNAEPSDEDLVTTKKLVKAGEILNINVQDHIIIGTSGEYCSFRQCGRIE